MELIFSIVQVALSVVLIFLVLMHSGKDAGLSGAFGVGTGRGPLGGGSLVERNPEPLDASGFAITRQRLDDGSCAASPATPSRIGSAHVRGTTPDASPVPTSASAATSTRTLRSPSSTAPAALDRRDARRP